MEIGTITKSWITNNFRSNAVTVTSMDISRETAPKYRSMKREKTGKKLRKGNQLTKTRKKRLGDMQNQPTSSNKPNQEATIAAPIIIQDVEEPQKIRDPAGKDPDPESIYGNHTGYNPSSKEVESQSTDPLEPGEIHPEPDVWTVAKPYGPPKKQMRTP